MGIFKLNGVDYMGGGGGGGNSNEQSLSYAEYLALSEAEKTNGTNYYIYDINGDGQEFQPIIYSEEEREVGVWTDGKPLYQKTFNFSSTISLASNTWVQIPNTFISNIDRGVKTICGYNHGNYNCIVSDLNASPIELYNTRNSTIAFDTFTLQYTKTTDAAGSGTWTPQGVPAKHYSTSEQVIGTWVDGSTLYEKTLYYNGLSSTNDWTELDSSVSYDMLISVNGVRYSNNQKFCFTNSLEDIPRFQTKNDGKLYYFTTSTFSGDFYITIQYTKSTTT